MHEPTCRKGDCVCEATKAIWARIEAVTDEMAKKDLRAAYEK
jgi:hypothetical protein